MVSLIDRDPVFHTDRTTSALIDFGEGRHLTFTTGTQMVPYQRVNVLGTKGRIEIAIPFNAPQGGAMRIYLDNGKELGDASAKTDQASQGRPVPAPGRGVLPRRPGQGAAGVRRRRRDQADAGDRRRLPLGEVRRLGEGLGRCRSEPAGFAPSPLAGEGSFAWRAAGELSERG